MADTKPVCKFGESCYRKNPQHVKQFHHPKRKLSEEEEPPLKKVKSEEKKVKGKTIADFFGKKTVAKEVKEVKEVKDHNLSDDEEPSASGDNVPDKDVETDEDQHNDDDDNDISESEEEADELDPPTSPVDIRENIKQKFLVDMPEDFYHFWKFCKSENKERPTDVFRSSLGFQLVGPYDIMAGKHNGVTKNSTGKRPNYLLHWRYYYDPPEFQTIIKGDNETQFHIGYFRDDPKETPAFVGANSAKNNCTISAKGDNVFAAVSFYVNEKLKCKEWSSTHKKEKVQLQGLSERLEVCAKKHDYSLDMTTKHMKARQKKVVCKSFHGAGIVVPVDENEVGYREVPETPGDLKKMFKKISDSKSEAERDKNFEALQELITLVQFANDECDYGEGLELGMDLFCYGGATFHNTIRQLVPLAYMLLGRLEYQKIIEAHLKNRRHDTKLSQLK